LNGLWILDLFAGSGAMGFEALSRGAEIVVLVDHHPAALRLIAKNLANCGNPGGVKMHRHDLRRGLKSLERQDYRFDMVFLDPPYHQGFSQSCLQQLGRSALLKPSACVVSEHGVDEHLSSSYGCLRLLNRRRYGSTGVSFYRWETD
jgi:16S rRNA (guanine(966)-N(2))-methyltransferase RsmD